MAAFANMQAGPSDSVGYRHSVPSVRLRPSPGQVVLRFAPPPPDPHPLFRYSQERRFDLECSLLPKQPFEATSSETKRSRRDARVTWFSQPSTSAVAEGRSGGDSGLGRPSPRIPAGQLSLFGGKVTVDVPAAPAPAAHAPGSTTTASLLRAHRHRVPSTSGVLGDQAAHTSVSAHSGPGGGPDSGRWVGDVGAGAGAGVGAGNVSGGRGDGRGAGARPQTAHTPGTWGQAPSLARRSTGAPVPPAEGERPVAEASAPVWAPANRRRARNPFVRGMGTPTIAQATATAAATPVRSTPLSRAARAPGAPASGVRTPNALDLLGRKRGTPTTGGTRATAPWTPKARTPSSTPRRSSTKRKHQAEVVVHNPLADLLRGADIINVGASPSAIMNFRSRCRGSTAVVYDLVEETLPPGAGADTRVVGVVFLVHGNDRAFLLPLCKEIRVATGDAAPTPSLLGGGGVGLVPLHERLECLRCFLSMEKVPKVCWETKRVLRALMVEWPELCMLDTKMLWDPRVAAWMLSPDSPQKELALGSVVGKFLPSIRAPPPRLAGAGCLQQRLKAINVLIPFARLEMGVVAALAAMEATGVRFQAGVLSRVKADLETRAGILETKAHGLAGRVFLVTSPHEVSKVMFEDLKLRPPRWATRSAKGHMPTTEDVLEAMRSQHELPGVILDHRKLSKLLSTYVRPLPTFAKTCREGGHDVIRTCLNQCNTGTGRLSSSNPNLQNLPTGKNRDAECVRQAFAARAGNVLVAVDYSQIEARIFAHMCADPALVEVFSRSDKTKSDLYSLLAVQIFSKRLESIAAAERAKAKTICLGIMYGIGAVETSKKLGISQDEARKLKQRFMAKFPGVGRFIAKIKKFAQSFGYVVTLTGRRRYLPDIKSSNSFKRTYAERQAVNTVIQGTAADVIKLAMIHMRRYLLHKYAEAQRLSGTAESVAPEFQGVLQIHDELLLECVDEPRAIRRTVELAKDCMERIVPVQLLELSMAVGGQRIPLRVPLRIKANVGRSWGTMTAFSLAPQA